MLYTYRTVKNAQKTRVCDVCVTYVIVVHQMACRGQACRKLCKKCKIARLQSLATAGG